ncbi:MAG TPA: vanadium-dependent haloperoxidase [Actinomycetes bacterium]|nr:vanadium-dependent haloperoxidase [Actinomycetes bacterium]
MRMRSGRGFTALALVVAVLVAGLEGTVRAQTAGPLDPDFPPPLYTINGLAPSKGDNVVLRWNEELLQSIRANPAATGPTVTARAIGVAHTSMFDAWVAYDGRAVGTRYGDKLQRPPQERTPENKNKAISFAAYATLVDLFPARANDFALQMKELGYSVDGSDTSTPAKIGTTAAQAVIAFRHKDGSNQLGGYADTTGYQPVNTPDKVIDRWRWQPLRVPLGTGNPQRALTPQWYQVTPFGMTSSYGRDVPGPPELPGGEWSATDIEDLAKETADLDDPSKIKAEYWADGPRSEFPPGHWAVFAQATSRKRGHSLDDDVKLFFALGNALMDASIAAWAWKYKYDYVRPITAIREHYRGQRIVSWLGPYKGYGLVNGENWIPYQELTVVTPPFPEYLSGHSTFSGAGARILSMFTGSDAFGASVTVRAGTSRIEPRTPSHPGTPAKDVTLSWPTFSAAAGEAGMSRRYGGIHFQSGDLHARELGREIGWDAWFKAQSYIKPISTGPI